MFKFILRLSATFLLSFLLITSNVLAFHKDGKYVREIKAGEGQKKNDVKSEYCTFLVEESTITEELTVDEDKETKTESLLFSAKNSLQSKTSLLLSSSADSSLQANKPSTRNNNNSFFIPTIYKNFKIKTIIH